VISKFICDENRATVRRFSAGALAGWSEAGHAFVAGTASARSCMMQYWTVCRCAEKRFVCPLSEVLPASIAVAMDVASRTARRGICR
jgi:hypothetical protein